MTAPALSFVIPLYYSSETIAAVVRDIEALEVPGGHEILLAVGEEDDAARRQLQRGAPADDRRVDDGIP